jgi:hypothetical protein
MLLLHSGRARALVLATSLIACSDAKQSTGPRAALDPAATTPSFTVGTGGSKSTLLGRATFSDPREKSLEIKRRTGDWRVQIEAKPALDIAVQTIDFPAGSQSGWHSHPGPVFIQVVSGTMTFYEGNDKTCSPIVKTAGQGYLDMGDHAHIARNESSLPAQNVVTYFAPVGAALRIDQPRPGNCPF